MFISIANLRIAYIHLILFQLPRLVLLGFISLWPSIKIAVCFSLAYTRGFNLTFTIHSVQLFYAYVAFPVAIGISLSNPNILLCTNEGRLTLLYKKAGQRNINYRLQREEDGQDNAYRIFGFAFRHLRTNLFKESECGFLQHSYWLAASFTQFWSHIKKKTFTKALHNCQYLTTTRSSNPLFAILAQHSHSVTHVQGKLDESDSGISVENSYGINIYYRTWNMNSLRRFCFR